MSRSTRSASRSRFGRSTASRGITRRWRPRLSSCGAAAVATESTWERWIPACEMLDRTGFEAVPVPQRTAKRIAGRKSDVVDCQWIRQFLSCGLLRGAFRPGHEICPVRSCALQAKRPIEDRARCARHMQKAPAEMNVRLDSVISDIAGAAG